MSYRRLIIGEILFRWDQFVPADLDNIQPDLQLAGLLEVRYGFSPERAKREAEGFLTDFADRLRRATAS